MSEFRGLYEQLVSDYYRPLQPSDGMEGSTITNCEYRLGYSLPVVLKEVYRLSGRLDTINQAYDHLLLPEGLWIDRGFLVFYQENQNVVFWGVDVELADRSDPPVLQAINEPESVWNQEFSYLSDFFINEFYWQAVNGGLPFGAIANIDQCTLAKVVDNWPSDKLMKGNNTSGIKVYCKKGQILCVSGDGPDYSLQVATNSLDTFQLIDKTLRVKWGGKWGS